MNLPSSKRACVLPAAPPPRPPAAGPAPPPLKADPDRNCPRCHTILTDPHGIGLCPRCGYCRSLQVEGVTVLAEAARRRRWGAALRGLRHALGVAPAALLAVAVAFIAVVPLAYLADQRLLPGSRERALWSAGHVIAGVLLLLSGEAWSITLLKQMNERVSWSDLLSPLQLWGLTLRRLPATAWPIGLGGSGVLAVLAAVVWVGGLGYWFRLYPMPAEDSAARAAGAHARDSGEESEFARVSRILGLGQSRDEETAERRQEAPIPSTATVRSPRQPTVVTTDPRPTERCVVVGFLPASDGRDAGLIVATLRRGELAFAGIVRRGLNKKPDLLDRLSKLSRSRPLIEGLSFDAVWVRPEMFCEVHQSGTDAKGELVDPNLKGLIED